MPFRTQYTSVLGVPHLFSKLDSETKSTYRLKYIKIKRTSIAGTVTIAGMVDGKQLAKDVVSSKLKAYGYKTFFSVISGPALQFLSIPIYVLSYGSKFRSFAIAISELGAKITKGEMEIVNWCWIGADLALFGELVPILDDTSLMILNNETDGHCLRIIETLGGSDG